MTRPLRILLHNDETTALAERLKSAHPEVEVGACRTYDGMSDALAAFKPDAVYTVRFDGTQGFPRDALFGPGGPQWIANGGVGTDHFGRWDARAVTVTNAAGVAADMMAEYILGGFLHFTLDVAGLQADKAARVWTARQMVPLQGKTLLIVGLGHTGRALAKRARAFGMTVTGTRATPRPMQDVARVEAATALSDLLADADAIAVATPLTSETRRLIGAGEIAAMKPGVLIADVSRGGVVDQGALADALQTGHVGAAVLDVFEVEPLPTDSPFWTLPNVLVSPHCSSVYEGWEMASFDLFLDNLARWKAGEALQNVVDPARGY